MKLVLALVWFTAGAVFAQNSTTNYYIERYPGDGMKQRPNNMPAKRPEDRIFNKPLQEKGPSSPIEETTSTTTNNTPTGVARYISPRVGSKEFAPSRLPTPKVKTVVVPKHEGNFPPSPKVTSKPGADALDTKPASEKSNTNSPPSAATSTK